MTIQPLREPATAHRRSGRLRAVIGPALCAAFANFVALTATLRSRRPR